MLIGQIDVLPQLFGDLAAPAAVVSELRHPRAPAEVRAWAAVPPPWLAVHSDPVEELAELRRLDPGERAAIMLARGLGAGLLLVDDRAAALAARAMGLEATGTLGVLGRAAEAHLLDLTRAVTALKATNFHCPAALLDALLDDRRRSSGAMRTDHA